MTIDGCSAGAGSTANHIVNKKSWPFFDQAAGESGVGAQWNVNTMQQSQLFFDTLVVDADCATVECLVNKSATELAAAAMQTVNDDDGFFANNALPYAPTVDGVDVVAPPLVLAEQGHIFPGPILLGTAHDECCSLEGNSYAFNLTLKGFEINTISDYGTENINITKTVGLYKGHPPTVNSKGAYSEWWWGSIAMGSDFGFHCPSRSAARTFEDHGHNVWLYSYAVPSYRGGALPGMLCTAHCTELASLFFSDRPDTSEHGVVIETMAKHWISFIKHGDPNVERKAGSIEWPQYRTGTDENIIFALVSDGGIQVDTAYKKAECDYWDTLQGGPCVTRKKKRATGTQRSRGDTADATGSVRAGNRSLPRFSNIFQSQSSNLKGP